MLVTIAIIGVVTAFVVANYLGSEQRQRVIYSTHQVEQDIRRMQAWSLAGKKDNAGADRPCGYGVKFDKNASSKYILFRDPGSVCPGDRIFTGASETIENGSVNLPSNLKINQITLIANDSTTTTPNSINIFYDIPFAAFFVDNSSNFKEADIQINNTSGFTKTIFIKSSGEISIN